MEQENQLPQIMEMQDTTKALKKLSTIEGVQNMDILAILSQNYSQSALTIFKEFTNNFSTLQGKEIVALILLFSTQDVDLEDILLCDGLLNANQYVGTFIVRFENALNNKHTLSQYIIDHIAQDKKNVPNFKLIYGKIHELAVEAKLNCKRLGELMQQEQKIQMIIDKPVIKILPLTPRIKQIYLPKKFQTQQPITADSQREELRQLSKRRMMTKKKLMRELYLEQNQLHQIKNEMINHKISKTKEGFKKGLRMLEEQQMELKRLKTMQVHRKNNKRKSTRKGGNKD